MLRVVKKKVQFFGFSLLELLLVIAIIGILLTIAVPFFQQAASETEESTAIADIKAIEQKMDQFDIIHNRLPLNAEELGGLPNDPWGNPYQYLNIGIQNDLGQVRKDRNQVPINTDYDLYNNGPDGSSVSPLTASQSHDDIIRANNGVFIGVAEEY